MTLRLRYLEHPKGSLREVLLRLAATLQENIDKLPQDASARIHHIRVLVKKIRSLLQLAGSTIPDADRNVLVPLLRRIKDIFFQFREQEVMRQCLQQLMDDSAAAEAIVRLRLVPADPAELPDTSHALELARELLLDLAALNFEKLTSEELVENASSFFRKARKLWRRCERAPHDDDMMHKWRIRVKNVLYHAAALSSLRPAKKLRAPLETMAGSLGEFHDLAVLETHSKGQPQIAGLVQIAKRKARKRCFKKACKVFQQKQGKFRKRLAKRLSRRK